MRIQTMKRRSGRRTTGTWVVAGFATILMGAAVIGGCQSGPAGSAAGNDEGGIRGDVTDIKPMGHAAPLAGPATFAPPLLNLSGTIPTAPQQVTESSAKATPVAEAESPVVFSPATSGFVKPVALTVAKSSLKSTVKPSLATTVKPTGKLAAHTSNKSHIVRKGETLFSIARAQYGDGNAWKRLATANPGIAHSSLKVGQRIVLP